MNEKMTKSLKRGKGQWEGKSLQNAGMPEHRETWKNCLQVLRIFINFQGGKNLKIGQNLIELEEKWCLH